jgi:HD-GYP domain-containing protein (c-di-GMP phosphodiesterase class II)/DNA-binding CsgD family transcriptional regulator
MELRLADLLCALSVTLDLAMSQPVEKSVRSCLLATALARELDLPEPQVRDVYYATLLRHLGCTATAHEEAFLFGPDAAALRPVAERSDRRNPRETLALFAQTGRGAGLHRMRYLGRTLRSGSAGEERMLTAICEVGSTLAGDLGLGPGVGTAVGQSLARWDGTGTPRGLAGDDIAIAARISDVATQAVIFDGLDGPDTALEMLRRRQRTWLDPDVVAAFERAGPGLLGQLAEADVWQAALDTEPEPHATARRTDEVARAFAHFTDLASPYLFGHSTGVADLVTGAASVLGTDDVAVLTQAALLHDLGRIAVPAAIWERPGPLRHGEWEQVRLHPYHTERILARSETLAPAGRIAGLHHERLDGSGYHRQAFGALVPQPARLLPEAAAGVVLDEAKAGRLDPECVRAVLETAGQPAAPRITWPAGLTDREVEVLRLLARGRSNREIAYDLVLSPRTAKHHVQHIYAKIGVSTRPAAALFAMRHGLFTP